MKILEKLENYSKQICSDDKTVRKKARKQIIDLTEAFTQFPDKKNTAKYPAWSKLKTYMDGMYWEAFPFQMNPKNAGEINHVFLLDDLNPTKHTHFQNSQKPCYIITLPHVPKLKEDTEFQSLSHQIQLITEEGFEENATASLKEAKERLALVIGINFFRSLDKTINQQCKKYIFSANKKFNSTHVKISGFYWEPIWIKGTETYSQSTVKRLYQLFAEVYPNKAKEVLRELMVNKSEIVPYQRIRDQIIKTSEVVHFYKLFNKNVEDRISMLGILDDDGIQYRTENNGKGLLSQYDQLIHDYPTLEVASTGYFMKNANQDFIEFASRADLYSRQAIAQTMPNGVYFPEPNLFIKIKNLDMLRNKISFIRKGPTKGKGLEFLGLMENLALNKGDVRGKVVMGKIGPILTSQPPRVNIPSHMPSSLAPAKINNKKNLGSLRMFCQSVLNPKKGFANSVARSLPTGMGSAKNTSKLSKIYTAFDPIDYIKTNSNWNIVYQEVIDALISIHYKKIDDPAYQPEFKEFAEKIIKTTNRPFTERQGIISLLEKKSNDLLVARDSLMNEAPKLSSSEVRTILVSAINANLTVFTYLQSRINDTDFVFPIMYE